MGNAIRGPAKVIIFNVIVCFLLLALGSTAQALVVQMDRQEVIQRSGLIFVGNVLEKNARWNEQGNLIVTDYVFTVDEVLMGEVGSNQLTLTFAGGQLGEEGHAVSDVPEFEEDDVVLLMLEESAHPLFSPVTGSYQGKFVAKNIVDSNHSNLAAFDGKDQAVRNESGDIIAFEDFVEMVRNEIPVARSNALPERSVPQELEHLVIEDLPSKVYDPSSVQSSMSAGSADSSPPAAAPQGDSILPENYTEVDLGDDGVDFLASGGESSARFVKDSHLWSSRPVFNQLRNYNYDQYQMSYWNKYADVFRVRTDGGTGTWAWQNGRSDMAGWVTNATMISQFGAGWGSGTLAVAYWRWNIFGTRIESDIAMNPAFSWTTNSYSTYYSSSVYSIPHTFLHELGHALGLRHQWYAQSVMNYDPKKYRAYTRLYVDDTMGARSCYPGWAVSRSDYGVHGYYYASYRNYDDATVSPTTVNAGSTVTVSNFIIDNTGTATVSPRINWYLVPNMVSWSGSRYIGTTTHASLSRNSYFKTSRTLTIPSGTPAGNYYLGAYIPSDTVGENNSTWVDRRITVRAAALAAEVRSLWPVGTKKQGDTARLWARVQNTGGATLPASARVYYWVSGPGLAAYVGSVSVGGLDPGDLSWKFYDWAIPANRTPGTHNYYARVWDTATGTWLGAWRGPQSFTVVAGVSADVTSLWPVGTKARGETAPLWALVKNTGGSALPASARVWYQVAGPGLNTYVGSVSVAGLAPGASRWYPYSWVIPANRTPGTHNYWAQVWDSAAGKWLGARKGPQSFTVVAKRLAAEVRSLWPPGVVGCGTTTPLWARVQNTGSATLPASARVYYYVSGPGFAGYVGWRSVGGLAPGALNWYSVSWAIPNNRTPGTHNYWARVWDTATGTWIGDWRGPQSFLVTCLR